MRPADEFVFFPRAHQYEGFIGVGDDAVGVGARGDELAVGKLYFFVNDIPSVDRFGAAVADDFGVGQDVGGGAHHGFILRRRAGGGFLSPRGAAVPESSPSGCWNGRCSLVPTRR